MLNYLMDVGKNSTPDQAFGIRDELHDKRIPSPSPSPSPRQVKVKV
jgi:hypothetical protein